MIDERRRRAAEHVIQVGGTFHMHAHKYRYMLWIYHTKVYLIGTIVFVVCACHHACGLAVIGGSARGSSSLT